MLTPATARERQIEKEVGGRVGGGSYRNAIKILRRIAAGLPAHATCKMQGELAKVGDELMRDLAREAAIKDRRAGRANSKRTSA